MTLAAATTNKRKLKLAGVHPRCCPALRIHLGETEQPIPGNDGPWVTRLCRARPRELWHGPNRCCATLAIGNSLPFLLEKSTEKSVV